MKTNFPIRDDKGQTRAALAASRQPIEASRILLGAAPRGQASALPAETPAPRGRDFTFLVTDDRYRTPTLSLGVGLDDDQAREQAAGVMRDSAHHTAIEAWVDDALVFRLDAAPSA
jgi:hypothetical protein